MAKRYKCPYCQNSENRKDLIDHIDKEHEELIPDGSESAQVVYDVVNKTKGAGRCRVCGGPTEWNSSAKRYDVLCKNPRCKEKMREDYKRNMLRVHGTYNILNNDEQQKKMLANRSISGKYKFTDGGEITYTGSYEKKFLEFADKVMQIPSKDIMAPGPTLEYEMDGQKHFYITDFLYIPYNLIIEVKDGGSNPNNKNSVGMQSSRQRTIEKEKLITDKGEYNYLRLTDNQFVQLLEIFMDIKKAIIEGNDDKIIKINESYISEANYNPPYSAQQIKDIYGIETYNRLSQDPAHLYRMNTGIELIHREPSKEELERIWNNWKLMTSNQKSQSDKKSIELFGKTNKEHYNELIGSYINEALIYPKALIKLSKHIPKGYVKAVSNMANSWQKGYDINKKNINKEIEKKKNKYDERYFSRAESEAGESMGDFKNKLDEYVKTFNKENESNWYKITYDGIGYDSHKDCYYADLFLEKGIKESYIFEDNHNKSLQEAKKIDNKSEIEDVIDTIFDYKIPKRKNKIYQSFNTFRAYHLEPDTKYKKQIHGGWDEELYSKSIEDAIYNDITTKYELRNRTEVYAYVYTTGADLKAIYLGRIIIFDKNNPSRWKWVEQEALNKSTYEYLMNNPIEEATDINNFYEEDYE